MLEILLSLASSHFSLGRMDKHPARSIPSHTAALELPVFSDIRPENVLPALDTLLSQNQTRIETLLKQDAADWGNLMQPLEEMEEAVHRLWSPVSHLNAVCDSETLRPVYQEGLMKLTAYQTDLAQNDALFAAIQSIHESASCDKLNSEQQQVVEHALRDFRLSGAALSTEDKFRFKHLQIRLSEMGTQFEQHLLDATRAWEMHITQANKLEGLPDAIRQSAAQRAEEADKKGWLFTLDAPSYIPFMQYAKHRDLREMMYRAYVTRACSGTQDNTPLIDEILKTRHETATLLGFENYATLSLASKMADSPDMVTAFLRDIAERSRSRAETELDALRQFSADHLNIAPLEAWDISFASEHLKEHLFHFSQEDLKPYFPEQQVLKGLFAVAHQLYHISIHEREDASDICWHEDVRYFDVWDEKEQCIAGFYLDPYARPHKRGGAWMDECIIRWRQVDGSLQIPVAYLVCNFDSPVRGATGNKPALWTHQEVITLFHEFGHGLHHMLTEVEALNVSGIRGVPWDAVELPSQFMEHYAWQCEALVMFARHYHSDEPLPDDLFDKMYAAKNFQSGMQMLRQIEFALFDLILHSTWSSEGNISVQHVLDTVRKEVAVFMPPAFNKFQNSFSHIFAGGYAAGYYSYKWAEVLSSDIFSKFEETTVFDHDTATALRRELLAVGGSRDIMEAFIKFRGRKPGVDALLRHTGITETPGKP